MECRRRRILRPCRHGWRSDLHASAYTHLHARMHEWHCCRELGCFAFLRELGCFAFRQHGTPNDTTGDGAQNSPTRMLIQRRFNYVCISIGNLETKRKFGFATVVHMRCYCELNCFACRQCRTKNNATRDGTQNNQTRTIIRLFRVPS